MKILDRVMDEMIWEMVKTDEKQLAFVQERSNLHHLAAPGEIPAPKRQHWEEYFAFVHLENVFYRLPHKVLWCVMRKAGVDKWIVCLVKAMHKTVMLTA